MQKSYDDLYVILYFDKEEEEFSMVIAEDLETLEQYMKNFTVITWANITGKEMKISEFHTEKTMKLENGLSLEEVRNIHND